ncbi:MAG: MerR family transcriptional regulator [Chloroflexi bacterium]|nr:MerR family transcriptional regulator [Chloroflexota bacterium]
MEGICIISVAAKLLDMHPQTLRKYERAGFCVPSRSMGMLRLYSMEDLARLKLIKHLVDDVGLNLAGVELALAMAGQLREMRRTLSSAREIDELRQTLDKDIQGMLQMLGASELT